MATRPVQQCAHCCNSTSASAQHLLPCVLSSCSYLYAANNPSESIVAKRRGYGTIVSYNVPPYGRAGLYKELASLRELVSATHIP